MHDWSSPALVADPAPPARRLCAAVLAQTVLDLASRDAATARRAAPMGRGGRPVVRGLLLAIGVDPRRFRHLLLRRFGRRVAGLVDRHRANLKPRGRPRKHPRKENHAFRASTNRLGP